MQVDGGRKQGQWQGRSAIEGLSECKELRPEGGGEPIHTKTNMAQVVQRQVY